MIAPVKEPTERISSIIYIKKPSKLRICFEQKNLNKAIKRPNYPFLTFSIFLAKFEPKFVSIVECKDVFWLVKPTESDSFLPTLWSSFGKFRWLRMPFGISSTPEELQKRLHEITAGLTGVKLLLIIFSFMVLPIPVLKNKPAPIMIET